MALPLWDLQIPSAIVLDSMIPLNVPPNLLPAFQSFELQPCVLTHHLIFKCSKTVSSTASGSSSDCLKVWDSWSNSKLALHSVIIAAGKSLVGVRFPVTSCKQIKRYNAFVSKFHWFFVLFILDSATKLAFNAGNFILIDHIDDPECYLSQSVEKEPHSQLSNSRV